MKVGDRVRMVYTPPGLPDEDLMDTPDLFAKLIGQVFTITDFQVVAGLPHPLIGLDVGEIRGTASFLETIWIEPEYVELVE